MRQERAAKFNSVGQPEGVKAKDVLHVCPEFYLYHGSVRGEKELILELPNGARYGLSIEYGGHGGYIACEDENYKTCMPERLIRDVEGLSDALAPIYSEFYEQGRLDRILLFAHHLKYAGVQSPLEEGAIAEAFTDKYSDKLKRYNEYKDEANDERDPRIIVSRRESDHPYASVFHDIYQDISTLAHFPKERDAVDPHLMLSTIEAAIEAGATGSARRVLLVMNNVSAWRESVEAKDILPMLNALAKQNTPYDGEILEYDISELFADSVDEQPVMPRPAPRSTNKYLAQTMSFLATTPHWRDGSEAELLPAAIDHILHKKDWPRLKQILHCATRLDDPVSEMWRDAIPQKLRDRIELSQFDNSYKAHHLDLLMQRMRDLDAGETQLYRLKEMPNTAEGREWYERGAERKRSSRESKKIIPQKDSFEPMSA